jgi:proline dehydrogenase
MAGTLKPTMLSKRHAFVQIRALSSRTSPKHASYVSPTTGAIADADAKTLSKAKAKQLPALSVLPLSTVIRSMLISSVSSSRLLLGPSLKLMDVLAHSNNLILSPDRNPLLKFCIKWTFYRQFCAGENAVEVERTLGGLKKLGYAGVILNYAREVVMDKKEAASLKPLESSSKEEIEACIRDEIGPWRKGTLETVRMTQAGDFVALK